MKRIIVANEKHQTRYLDASTDAAWAASSLALLSQRFRDGYWYYDPSSETDEFSLRLRRERDELLAMTEETLGALPQAVRAEVQRKIEVARREKLADDEAKETYEAIKRIVETQDDGWTHGKRFNEPKAWVLLARRADYEYERVELEEVESENA